MNRTEHNKKAVIEALEKSLGIVSTACKAAGVGRTQFYTWVKEDADFKKQVDEIEGVALDYVESKLFEKIDGVYINQGHDNENEEARVYKVPPSDTAIIFYLKTKGKKRGYVERQEIAISDQPFILELSNEADSETNTSV